jgi:hypothetical protein
MCPHDTVISSDLFKQSQPPATNLNQSHKQTGRSLPLVASSAMRETAKQKACRKATSEETTKQVNNLIGEFFILPSSPSQEPKREPENIQLPTEHLHKHSNVTTIHEQIELVDDGHNKQLIKRIKGQTEHAARQIEHAERQMECVKKQTEHAERQTKQAERQTEHAKKQIEQAERQTEHAARQTERAARQIEHVEWHTNWHTDFQPFVHKQVNEHTLTCSDWPNNLIEIIKKVINVPCNTPTAPKFIFKLLQTAASHNLDVLSKYQNDLSKALEANKSSPLGYGSEFRHPNKPQKIFGLHPLWPRMKQILIQGSKWSLDKLSKESWQKDLINALTFGNHKGASAKPELLRHSISKYVKYGYSLPIPLSCIKSIPGLLMAPMNIIAQNTINEIGQITPKD